MCLVLLCCRFLGGDGARSWARKRGLEAAASFEEAKQVAHEDFAACNVIAMWLSYSQACMQLSEQALLSSGI